MRWEEFDWLIEAAISEDAARGDVTSRALVSEELACAADVVVRQDGVVCGLPLAARAAAMLDGRLELSPVRQDGDRVAGGTVVATLAGPAVSLLAAERTMLNFLQHLGGVATLTRRFCDAVEGTGAAIYDTRKTTPGWRALEKYAVRCGGGTNHRMGLADQVLIKDNHLALGGDGPGCVGRAVRRAREAAAGRAVEVEVESLAGLQEALEAGADVVMLDNMTPAQVREAAALVRERCSAGGRRPQLEASGSVDLALARAYAEAGADRISIGALTHSAPALDVALDLKTG